MCDRGVGSNSILCGTCGRWTHKKCSGVRGSLTKVKNFECRRCSREIAGEGERGCEKVEVEPGMFLERVSKFCYLREMLGEEGGAELPVINRTRDKRGESR